MANKKIKEMDFFNENIVDTKAINKLSSKKLKELNSILDKINYWQLDKWIKITYNKVMY